jgi:PAS domain S-box-containing protein
MQERLEPLFFENQSDKRAMDRLETGDIDHVFKELVNASPVAIYTCDQQGYITFFNQAAAALWGRQPEIGEDMWCGSWKIYYPSGTPMPPDQCPMARTLKEGKPFDGEEITIERPDHTFRNLLVFPRPMFNDRNIVIGAHNTLVDITEQKKGEEKQAMLSAIVESSDDAIISKNLNGIILSWNAGAQKIFGYTEQEVIGKSIHILIPNSLRTEETKIIRDIKSGTKIGHYQTVRLAKSGKEIPVSLTVSPIKDHHGHVIGASKIARDISELLQTENIIKQSVQRLAILNAIGKVISEKLDAPSILQLVTDATTKIAGAHFGAFFYNTIDESGEACMLLKSSGVPLEAFEQFGISQNTVDFKSAFGSEGVTRVDDIRNDARYGKNGTYYWAPKDHSPVASYMAVPLIASSGIVMGGLFFGHPEPAMFTAEHEETVISIASQAMVALDNAKLFEQVKALSAKKDEFIALASHELKTPLTTIKGYLQILEKKEKEKADKLFIERTLNQVDKLNSLVSDLFDISKIEAGTLLLYNETFDIRELIFEVIETFHYTNRTHQIIFRDAGQPLFIKADKQRMEQVMINLVANAIKYSPKANMVRIVVEQTDISVTVRIKDEGIGLSPSQQKKIFTRFYRAEGTSNVPGLGLGLYLTKEIIDRHYGTINVSSELGKGSEFFFSLPLQSINPK